MYIYLCYILYYITIYLKSLYLLSKTYVAKLLAPLIIFYCSFHYFLMCITLSMPQLLACNTCSRTCVCLCLQPLRASASVFPRLPAPTAAFTVTCWFCSILSSLVGMVRVIGVCHWENQCQSLRRAPHDLAQGRWSTEKGGQGPLSAVQYFQTSRHRLD